MPLAHQLLRKFADLKTLPHVAIRLSKLLSEERTALQQFEDVIKLDPVLVSRLLRMVNSAYFGLRESITSISRALVFLGTKNLRNMVVTEAIKDIIHCKTDDSVFSRKKLWLHCAAVSILGQMISERVFGRRGEDVYLCGILHDIGMIIEDQTTPELFAQSCKTVSVAPRPFVEIEKDIIGTDHCVLGFLLSEEWRLHEDVKKGIRDHHLTSEDLEPTSITGLIQMAESFACRLGYFPLPGIEGVLSPSLLRFVQENSQEFRILIQEMPDQMAKARELYETDEGIENA